jgi:hypothetical protein
MIGQQNKLMRRIKQFGKTGMKSRGIRPMEHDLHEILPHMVIIFAP